MSALLIGKGCRMGSVVDRLLELGFTEVAFRNCKRMAECRTPGLCNPDVVIIMKDGLMESEIKSVYSKTCGLEVPVVIW